MRNGFLYLTDIVSDRCVSALNSIKLPKIFMDPGNRQILVDLDLDKNVITDFTPLYGLRNLAMLSICADGVEQSEIDALREALPGCSILVSGTPKTAENKPAE